MTETDTRPTLVGEHDHDMRVVARARDPQLEVFGDPIDERLPYRGSSGQRVATSPSCSKPLQILVFLAVEPAPMIANPLDPDHLFLAEDHRPAGRADPPVNEDLLQAALLHAEVVPPLVFVALVDHPNSLPQKA